MAVPTATASHTTAVPSLSSQIAAVDVRPITCRGDSASQGPLRDQVAAGRIGLWDVCVLGIGNGHRASGLRHHRQRAGPRAGRIGAVRADPVVIAIHWHHC